VPLPEIMALNERESLVQLASNADEFIREIETALEQHSPELAPELVARRRAFARENTWLARGEEFLPIAQNCFPKASIVIVTYHNRELNRECLQALYERTEWPNFEVLVVDNASTDGTPEMLRGLEGKYPGLTIMLNEQNLGFAKANNQALRQAKGEYLVLLNNDTVVTRGWLAGLIRHLAADEYLGLVGPVTNEIGNEAKIAVRYFQPADMPRWARRYVREHDNDLTDMPMLAMFCVAIRREVFAAIGELDERFGIGMFEDDDYSYRIRHAGLKTQCAKDVFIHHHGQASFKMMDEEQYRALFEENRRRYEEKWGEPWVSHSARS
jgi:GT2 family glycosyltransferase